MAEIAIVIPSRLARQNTLPSEPLFLERAVESIRRQDLPNDTKVNVFVGIDVNANLPAGLDRKLDVTFVHSCGRSQAAALNAAADRATGDFLAFLEDDDIWQPSYLREALNALDSADFVSSTQLERSETGEVVRVNDFPTPSGWLLRRAVWEQVGPFDEEFKLHLDNEWLGRLKVSDMKRIHLVEATAPVHMHVVRQVRPWLANVLTIGGPAVSLSRHESPYPLVTRLIHQNSGMGQIASNPDMRARSEYELERLHTIFGQIPW